MIFNADETGLYYRMLPKRTYATYNNDSVGTKKARGLIIKKMHVQIKKAQ